MNLIFTRVYMDIRHLAHKSIDFNKWDQVITDAANGMIYARSWYLNIVSPGWEALVADDYMFIFPITIKRKYKLPYIVQPKLNQQLGVFSNSPVTDEIIRKFIQKLPTYSYEINLNETNVLKGAEQFPNYVLSLNKPYEELNSAYSKNTIRNITKAKKLDLRIDYTLSAESFIMFYQSVNKPYQCLDCEMLLKLIRTGLEMKELKLAGVVNASGEMIAGLCYADFKQRITYLVPVSDEQGKKDFAMFFLVDEIISKHAGSDKLFDFEGSKFEGIARFYKGFGAKNQPYNIIKKLRPSFLVGRI